MKKNIDIPNVALLLTFGSYAQPCVAPAARLRIGAVMPRFSLRSYLESK